MDEINENTSIQEQLILNQMTERETRERSKLNLKTVLNAMNQQHAKKQMNWTQNMPTE